MPRRWRHRSARPTVPAEQGASTTLLPRVVRWYVRIDPLRGRPDRRGEGRRLGEGIRGLCLVKQLVVLAAVMGAHGLELRREPAAAVGLVLRVDHEVTAALFQLLHLLGLSCQLADMHPELLAVNINLAPQVKVKSYAGWGEIVGLAVRAG
jgi:hypothetical protein